MRSFSISRVFDHHTRSVVAAMGLLFATLLPAVVPAFASAALVTDRSVALSSSTKDAAGVSYQVKFTSVGAAGGFVIDFCGNTPLIGESCSTSTGFSVSSATTATAGWTRTVVDANTLKLAGTIGAGSTITVDIDAVHNPTAAGPLYARIVTYDTAAHMANYTDAETLGANTVDQGSVALSITEGVNVSGKVLETLTFCVSKLAITTAGCGGSLTTPTLELGELVGSVKALTTGVVSTGDIFTQISTNASGGAIVSLKSGNTCGGLKRPEASAGTCDIAPSTTSGFTDVSTNTAKFGVKVTPDTGTDSSLGATGTFQIHSGSNYDDTNYRLNWTNGSTTAGVSSTYGDPILDTGVTQPSNRNMKLTFGAQITNNTPAGSYATSLSLIATGKF